jgi:serine phosphatase RsbU (regulator of sigma subunit)
LLLVADRIALATKAQESETDRMAAAALQRSLLPSRLPDLPGFELAARYVPSEETGVSGDWYDVFRLNSGRLGIVIGDVAGHGLPAAVVMGRLRSALRAYALETDDPGTVLEKLDRKITHFEPGAMATVAYAVIEPDRRNIRVALAGHPPPVLAKPGSQTRLLDIKADPLLGFDADHTTRHTYTIAMPAGAVLCFYTDGLVERRDIPIDIRLAHLCEAVGTQPPDEVCATVMDALVGDRHPRDDVAFLAIRRTPD